MLYPFVYKMREETFDVFEQGITDKLRKPFWDLGQKMWVDVSLSLDRGTDGTQKLLMMHM